MFDHKEPFVKCVFDSSWYGNYSMSYVHGYFWTTYLPYFSLWYSQSQWEQELSWRCVFSVCSFTREPKSSEARVSPTISVLFTCEHFPIEFHLLLYTCMDDGVDPWLSIIVVIRWLCTFLTHYHGSKKSSHLGPTTECAYQVWCVWPQGIMVLIFHHVLWFKHLCTFMVIYWTTSIFVICHSAASVRRTSRTKELMHLVKLYE